MQFSRKFYLEKEIIIFFHCIFYRIGGKDGLAELLVSQAMTAKIINDVRGIHIILSLKKNFHSICIYLLKFKKFHYPFS